MLLLEFGAVAILNFLRLACRLRQLQKHDRVHQKFRTPIRITKRGSPAIKHQTGFAHFAESIDRFNIHQPEGESALEELRRLVLLEFDTGDDEGDFLFNFQHDLTFWVAGKEVFPLVLLCLN